MVKKISINALTLLRIPLSILFCFILLRTRYPLIPCVVLFVLVVATDFLDGKVARRYMAQTQIGAVLDVSCDFFFIFLTCITLSFQRLLPYWMLMVILFKFIEFLLTSRDLRRRNKTKSIFIFDPAGRLTAILFYLLPVFILICQNILIPHTFRLTTQIACIAITILALISTTFRLSSQRPVEKLL